MGDNELLNAFIICLPIKTVRYDVEDGKARKTFDDIIKASEFLCEEIDAYEYTTISHKEIEVVFVDDTLGSLRFSFPYEIDKYNKPDRMLQRITLMILLRQFHSNLERGLPIVSDQFLKQIANCMEPRLVMSDPDIVLESGSMEEKVRTRLEIICQNHYGEIPKKTKRQKRKSLRLMCRDMVEMDWVSQVWLDTLLGKFKELGYNKKIIRWLLAGYSKVRGEHDLIMYSLKWPIDYGVDLSTSRYLDKFVLELPDEMFIMDNLNSIILSDSYQIQCEQDIPVPIEKIPSIIFTLPNLNSLNIGMNLLKTMHIDVSEMRSLECLDISGCHLKDFRMTGDEKLNIRMKHIFYFDGISEGQIDKSFKLRGIYLSPSLTKGVSMSGDWTKIISHPSMNLVLGGKNMGKTALGYQLMDKLGNELGLGKIVFGFPGSKELLPDDFKIVGDISFPSDSLIMIDEITLFKYAKRVKGSPMAIFIQILDTYRQKRQIIFYIVHSSRILDVYTIGRSDTIIYKSPSKYIVERDKPTAKKLSTMAYEHLHGRDKSYSYVFLEKDEEILMVNDLPYFWSEDLSQSERHL